MSSRSRVLTCSAVARAMDSLLSRECSMAVAHLHEACAALEVLAVPLGFLDTSSGYR